MAFENTVLAAAGRILVTGADGFLGRGLLAALARRPGVGAGAVVATDVREVPEPRRLPGVTYLRLDVRDPGLGQVIAVRGIRTVVHLASIVTPGKGSTRAMEHAVDVGGTRNVLDACISQCVSHLIVSSSGAAYGYHADHPAWLTEDHPLRADGSFAYAHHKRLAEEMLAQARSRHPQLAQTVFRIGTILGERVDNHVTALFEAPRPIAIAGSDSPFVFVWDEDVCGALMHAIDGGGPPGCYNLAGDGALTLHEIAARLGKRPRVWNAGLLRAALRVGRALGLSRHGPELIDFLRYRPVLCNTALKERFGYVPRKTSTQAFDAFVAARAAQGRAVGAR